MVISDVVKLEVYPLAHGGSKARVGEKCGPYVSTTFTLRLENERTDSGRDTRSYLESYQVDHKKKDWQPYVIDTQSAQNDLPAPSSSRGPFLHNIPSSAYVTGV